MPIYEFECKKCKKRKEIIIQFGLFQESDENFEVGSCKCGNSLKKTDQIINFAGHINMNASAMGISTKKYSNKAGGPKPIIDGKVRDDIKRK